MCTNPIYMRNPKFRFIKGLNDNFSKIVVPCGECEECLRSKANSIYVRARMEYDACIKHGGVGFMTCLTYSDDCLPLINMNGERVSVFNKKDVIDFIKRLRTNLDRKYKKTFNQSAPDFKYLICSEFGSKHGRPHYHALFFFYKSISLNMFRTAFYESTYCRINGHFKRFFGYILQCEPIDPTRGGIHYSSKYVCKDIMYKDQNDFIRSKIDFLRRVVNKKYGIIEFPTTQDDFLKNRCIRSRTDYKQDVQNIIRRWRHRLQFCMMSNDLGASCIVEKYGENLVDTPFINFDGFPYVVPPIVKEYFERKYGFSLRMKLQKTSFEKFVSRAFEQLVNFNEMSPVKAQDLKLFVHEYVQPFGGRLMLVHPSSVDDIEKSILFRPWNELVDEFRFFDDNSFFDLCHEVSHYLKLFNFGDTAKFRYRLSKEKFEREKNEYEQKRRNKGYA